MKCSVKEFLPFCFQMYSVHVLTTYMYILLSINSRKHKTSGFAIVWKLL